MCTLTIFPNKDGDLIITMNRDERKSRKEADDLFRKEQIIYPYDLKSKFY